MPAHASPYCNKMFAPSSMSANDRPFINEFKYKKDDLGLRKTQKMYLHISHVKIFICVHFSFELHVYST